MSDENSDVIRRVIDTHADYFAAPEELRRSLRTLIAAEADAPQGAQHKRAWFTFDPGHWRALALGVVAGVAVTVGVVGWQDWGHADTDPTLVALAADHARAIVTNTTIEVVTADKHTVKPWLARTLGASPDVVDLAEAGFPLLGGRRGYLAGMAVPVMAYGFKAHEIDVYALPDATRTAHAAGSLSIDGFHCISWQADGFTYVAISDIDRDRLAQFVSAFKSHA